MKIKIIWFSVILILTSFLLSFGITKYEINTNIDASKERETEYEKIECSTYQPPADLVLDTETQKFIDKLSLGCIEFKKDMIEEQKEIQSEWENYGSLKIILFRTVRISVLALLIGMSFSLFFAKSKTSKIKSFMTLVSIIPIILLADLCLRLFTNTHVVGLTNTLYSFESLILIIIVVMGSFIAYLASNGGAIYDYLFPKFKARNKPKINLENEPELKRWEKIYDALNNSKKLLFIVIAISISLSIYLMYIAKIKYDNDIAYKENITDVEITVVEIITNFTPSIFIILLALLVQLNSSKKRLKWLISIITSIVFLATPLFLIYFLADVSRYSKLNINYIAPQSLFLYVSLVMGTLILTYLDQHIRSKKNLAYALKANVIPIRIKNRFKVYLIEVKLEVIDPISKHLFKLSMNYNRKEIINYLYLLKGSAEETRNYLNKYKGRVTKINFDSRAQDYDVLIREIDSLIESLDENLDEKKMLQATQLPSKLEVLNDSLIKALSD